MEQRCNYMALVTDIFNSLSLLLPLISLPLYSYLSSLPPPPLPPPSISLCVGFFRFNLICSHQPPLLSCVLWMTSLWMKPGRCWSELLFVGIYWYSLVNQTPNFQSFIHHASYLIQTICMYHWQLNLMSELFPAALCTIFVQYWNQQL